MADALGEFLANPSGKTFLDLRDLVLDQPEYDFHSGALAEVDDLVAAGEYDAVPGRLSDVMPNWLLSPRMHLLVGQAAEERGDAETAQRELVLAHALLRGLLESGDGSRTQPYRITHIDDEYDLLEALDKQPVTHRMLSDDPAGPLDLIVCTDGSKLYFEIGPGLAQAAMANR